MNLPQVVSRDEWRVARQQFLAQEKAATRAYDALNAERRMLPMVAIDKQYTFVGPDGTKSLNDLFAGRCQLIIYHFMFAPDWEEGCKGCSFLVDNIGHLAHLHARDTSFVLVSRAPLATITPFKQRMGWSMPWYSSFGSDFNYDFEATTEQGEDHVLSVFLRDDDTVYHTYSTNGRGTDIVGSTYSYLDLTPLGRQEDWEQPSGRSNTTAQGWVRYHDTY